MEALNVLITVDTEVWPRYPDWLETALTKDIARDIYGITEKGEFGITFQIGVLNSFGLKAVFFVEPLFAGAAGCDPLRALIRTIREGGHDVQLHLHTEWLARLPSCLPAGRTGQFLNEFSEQEQKLLIGEGAAILRQSGAPDLCAFRAGNFGANLNTLRALAGNGFLFDSSYNFCYLPFQCKMDVAHPLLQPERVEDVLEFPVGFFSDWPGHYRHAQVCACSVEELKTVLLAAWGQQWFSFVLVMHSSELLRGRKQTRRPPDPNWVVVNRFRSLCEFLGANRDKFRTMAFSDLRDRLPAEMPRATIVRSRLRHTALRCVEQLIGELF